MFFIFLFVHFLLFLRKMFLLFLYCLVFFKIPFHCWLTNVSPAVGAPWRCGVTRQGGVSRVRLGHVLGREHDSTPWSGAEAPRDRKRCLSRLFYCCCFGRRLSGGVCMSTRLRHLIVMHSQIPVASHLGVRLPSPPAPALAIRPPAEVRPFTSRHVTHHAHG